MGLLETARQSPASAGVSLLSLAATVYNVVVELASQRKEHDVDVPVSEIVLVPSNTLLTHWYFWNVLTANFCDISVLKGALFTGVFFALSRKAEAGFGIRGYLSFLLVSSTLVGMVSSFIMLLMYFTRSEEYFYETLLCGQGGVLISAAIASVRVDIDDTLLKTGIHTRKIVLPALFGYTFLWVLDSRISGKHGMDGASWIHDLCFSWVSFFVSFFLVRLADFTSEDSICTARILFEGDTFCFDAFFPQPLRPVIRTISLLLEGLLQRIFGSCLGKNTSYSSPTQGTLPLVNGQYSGYVTNVSGSGVQRVGGVGLSMSLNAKRSSLVKTNPVEDRRRARALKALDMKLAQMSKEPEVALDEVEDDSKVADVEATATLEPESTQVESASTSAITGDSLS